MSAPAPFRRSAARQTVPRATLLAAALLAALTLNGTAQAQTLDLLQAYAAARQHDPSFRAAQAARDAGLEDRILGRAQLLPTVTASASTERNRIRANEREVLLATGTTQTSSVTSSSEQISSRNDNQGGLLGPSQTSSGTYREAHQNDSGVVNSQSSSDEQALETTRVRSSNAALQIRQPLLNWAATAAYRQGKALSAAAEARFRSQQQELMIRVTEAYAQTLFAMENRRLAQSQLDTLSEQQVNNERMLEGGEGTLTDVLETRAKRQIAQAQLIEAEDNLATARSRLRAITGLPAEELAPLKTQLMVPAADAPTHEDWKALAMARNGLLESLRHQVEAAQEEARKADAGHYPRLDLVAGLGRNENLTTPLTTTTTTTTVNRDGSTLSSSSSHSNTSTVNAAGGTPQATSSQTSSTTQSQTSSSTTSTANTYKADSNRRHTTNHRIGLELNVPLYAGGAISARARQAAARLVQSQAEMDARVDEVLLELNRQWRLQQSTSQRAMALEQAVVSSQVAIEATQKSLVAGVRTNLDVLNARERLVAAERELASARYSHLLAYLRLRFHAGVLAEEDLLAVAAPR